MKLDLQGNKALRNNMQPQYRIKLGQNFRLSFSTNRTRESRILRSEPQTIGRRRAASSSGAAVARIIIMRYLSSDRTGLTRAARAAITAFLRRGRKNAGTV